MYPDVDLLRERLINTVNAQIISIFASVWQKWKTWEAEAAL